MKRLLWGFALMLLAEIPSGALGTPLDSATSADTARVSRGMDSDSTRATPAFLVLTLDKQQEVVAVRVGPGGMGYVRAVRPDGEVVLVPVHRIRSIQDLDGGDWTREVVDLRREIGTESGLPARVPKKLPPSDGSGAGWYPFFHFGLATRTDEGSPLYERGAFYALGDLGGMRRLGKHFALGGGLYVGGDDYRLRFGPKARFALFLSPDLSVELAPGLLVAGDEDWGGEVDYPGVVGELSVNVHRAVLFTGEFEQVRIEKYGVEDTDTSWYFGAKLAGVPGLVGLTAGLVTLLILHTTLDAELW